MEDTSIINHIESLVEQEQRLLAREQNDARDSDVLADDRRQLERISVELDRCWDLLRQRRALRDAGQEPAFARLRDANTVERYWQ
jgi:predicted dithiol-disulfide oxidoreductase (DUF899 family)